MDEVSEQIRAELKAAGDSMDSGMTVCAFHQLINAVLMLEKQIAPIREQLAALKCCSICGAVFRGERCPAEKLNQETGVSYHS